MTLISWNGTGPILKNGAIGTEQACCCSAAECCDALPGSVSFTIPTLPDPPAGPNYDAYLIAKDLISGLTFVLTGPTAIPGVTNRVYYQYAWTDGNEQQISMVLYVRCGETGFRDGAPTFLLVLSAVEIPGPPIISGKYEYIAGSTGSAAEIADLFNICTGTPTTRDGVFSDLSVAFTMTIGT
jgi:hypothetical protein